MVTFDIKATKSLIGRNAARFIQLISSIKTDIYINKNDRKINAKSILGLLSASIMEGDKLEIAVFDDCEKNNVLDTLNNFFYEE